MILHTNKHRIPFIIDDADYESVRERSWYYHKSTGYITTSVRSLGFKWEIPLHTFLMGPAPLNLEWDHRNRDKLDNRRDNLRAVTRSVNMRNRNIRADNRTGVQGVRNTRGRWNAYIQTDGERIVLGHFDTFEEARDARLAAEKLYWKDDS